MTKKNEKASNVALLAETTTTLSENQFRINLHLQRNERYQLASHQECATWCRKPDELIRARNLSHHHHVYWFIKTAPSRAHHTQLLTTSSTTGVPSLSLFFKLVISLCLIPIWLGSFLVDLLRSRFRFSFFTGLTGSQRNVQQNCLCVRPRACFTFSFAVGIKDNWISKWGTHVSSKWKDE